MYVSFGKDYSQRPHVAFIKHLVDCNLVDVLTNSQSGNIMIPASYTVDMLTTCKQLHSTCIYMYHTVLNLMGLKLRQLVTIFNFIQWSLGNSVWQIAKSIARELLLSRGIGMEQQICDYNQSGFSFPQIAFDMLRMDLHVRACSLSQACYFDPMTKETSYIP